MRILIIGGMWMEVGDGDAYWALAEALREQGHEVAVAECLESGTPKNIVTLQDVQWAEGVICYSYGAASLWALQYPAWNKGQSVASYRRLAMIAGVNDIGQGQGNSVWHPPAHVLAAICFQPTKARPISQPFRDTGTWMEFFRLSPRDVADYRRLNVNCDLLVDGLGPVSMHTHIKDVTELLEAVASWFGSEPPAAGATPALQESA